MSVRSFQAKVHCTTPEHRRWLELTHRHYNDCLRPVVVELLRARRGDRGPEFQAIVAHIRNAQGASRVLESITSLKSESGRSKATEWSDLARQLRAQRRLLFDRTEVIPGVANEFRRKVFENAIAIILSHEEKMKQWRADHEAWLKQKAEWEQTHPEYMRVRPVIEEFENAEGKVSKRRGRWHRWLDFLSSNPGLAAWRGGPASVLPLTAEQQRAANADRRPVRAAFEIFWAGNPELYELDRQHGEYERRFVRRYKRKRHFDGFDHPPTLTLPSADRHPAWYSFKGGATYRTPDIAKGTIQLKVVRRSEMGEQSQKGFLAYRFIGDPRMRRLRPARESRVVDRFNCDLEYQSPGEPSTRAARVQGVKLVFRSGQPYLYFSVFIEDRPSRLQVTQQALDKYSRTWVTNRVREEARPLDPPLRTMAVDLGIRHLAAVTVMQGNSLLATRFIRHRYVSPKSGCTIAAVPTLGQIAQMKQRLRRARRKRGKPVKGQESCRRIQQHVTQMARDRFRKAAAAIVDFARCWDVDLILMEQLEGLVPDAERERGINRSLINWNRRQLVDQIRQTAEFAGVRLVELPPYWTSQVCHRCNVLGQRYSIVDREPKRELVGKLFGCAACGYSANADYNASVNLHRVLHGSFPQIKSLKNGRVQCNGTTLDLAELREQWDRAWAARTLSRETPF